MKKIIFLFISSLTFSHLKASPPGESPFTGRLRKSLEVKKEHRQKKRESQSLKVIVETSLGASPNLPRKARSPKPQRK